MRSPPLPLTAGAAAAANYRINALAVLKARQEEEKLLGRKFPDRGEEILEQHLPSSCGGFWILSRYRRIAFGPMRDARVSTEETNHGYEPFDDNERGNFLKAHSLETVSYVDTLRLEAQNQFEIDLTLAKWRKSKVPLAQPNPLGPETVIFFYARLSAVKAIEFRMLFG